MTRHVVRLLCTLLLMVAGTGVAITPASAAQSYTCSISSSSSAVYTYGDPGQKRWGWANTVNSAGCNHWASVALHAPLPPGYQVNVTLERNNLAEDTPPDHRYCHFRGSATSTQRTCATLPAIFTTSCVWTYRTIVEIYIWNGASWALVAWNPESPESSGWAVC